MISGLHSIQGERREDNEEERVQKEHMTTPGRSMVDLLYPGFPTLLIFL